MLAIAALSAMATTQILSEVSNLQAHPKRVADDFLPYRMQPRGWCLDMRSYAVPECELWLPIQLNSLILKNVMMTNSTLDS